jgi:MFS family permease
MVMTLNDFRLVFWFAVISAFLAVGILIVGVEEPPSPRPAGEARSPIRAAEVRSLGSGYWAVVIVATILNFARFSEAFLLLRAQELGLTIALVPMVLVVMNTVYALSAYPAGRLSDVIDRRLVIAGGGSMLIAADIVMAMAASPFAVFVGVVLWGLHMGSTQGVFATLVTDTAPARLRGTAFGIFNLAGGVAMLIASFVAGGLWTRYGAAASFYAGTGFTTASLVALIALRTSRDSKKDGVP